MAAGYHAIVGNPPFVGGKRVTTACGRSYAEWLVATQPDTNNNADLSAFFFRRAFDLVRKGGTSGLLATKTIAEGDTRKAGLAALRRRGAVIYAATRRRPWPGTASVIVSVVHVRKGARHEPVLLDGRVVPEITAFLFQGRSDDDPARVSAEPKRSFIGCFLRGMGFTFDDAAKEATPLATLDALRASHPGIDEVVRPYLGGEEVLEHPSHEAHRFVIDFAGREEDEARRCFPALMDIIDAKVRPQREALGTSAIDLAHKRRYWLFANDRPELRRAAAGLAFVLAIPRVSGHLSVAALRPDQVFSDQLVLITIDRMSAFAVLQSRAHEIWARFFCSTMGEGLRYAPSDGFETFPFPPDGESNAALEAAGKTYHELRATLMVRNDQGLTATYNRFHDPDEHDADILKLRELHAAMDRAVLDAYGWTDLEPTCAFLLDHEEEENDDDEGSKRRKKKPWRYRWPDELRDEVLARLIALNQERAEHGAGTGGSSRR